MSQINGTRSITNGLVLNIDAANRNSMAGVGTERIGGIKQTFDAWAGLTGSSTNYSAQYSSNGVGVYLNTITAGGVGWWLSNNGATACLASTQYIISARVKYAGSSTTPSANLFYVRQYNSGGTQTSEAGKFSTATMTSLGNDWYLAWAYFVTDSTAASFLVQGYEYSANMTIWLEDVRCKVAGLGDLSGSNNNGSLTGQMSLAATNDGVMQLTGSNYISTGLNLSTGTYTVLAAARYTAIGGRIITAGTNNWLLGAWGTTTENYYAEGWVSPGGAGASDTNWRIIAGTGNPQTDVWEIYVNGSLTYSNSGGSAGPNGLGINIYSEHSSSEVGFLLAYNRVLSSSEIYQLFTAYRTRYNL